jgi:RHS repeat-associated protein
MQNPISIFMKTAIFLLLSICCVQIISAQTTVVRNGKTYKQYIVYKDSAGCTIIDADRYQELKSKDTSSKPIPPNNFWGISGATSVVPGTPYTYELTGSFFPSYTFWLVYCGAFTSPVGIGNLSADIIWLGSCSSGTVIVEDEFAMELARLEVFIQAPPPPLNPGTISGGGVICSGSLPGTITGENASGGSCGASYLYQWEYSQDGFTWDPIYGAVDKDYSPDPLYTPTYFRRYTICGSIAYSNIVYYGLTYPPSVAEISGDNTICRFDTKQFTNSTPGGTWISDDIAVIIVAPNGQVTAVNAGSAYLRYRVSNSCGSSDVVKLITVNAAPDVNYISPTSITLCPGNSTLFSAGPATGGTWSLSDPNIATVVPQRFGEEATLTASTSGNAVLYYSVSNSCGTSSVYAYVYVNPLPSAGSISVQSGNIAGLCKGQSAQLTSNVGGGNWTTSDNLVATVDQYGVVTGRLEGFATIYYTVGNSCGTAQTSIPVTVLADPNPGSINGASEVCRSGNTMLSATVAGGTWISDHPSIATVNSSGVVTGVNTGVATIRYRVANSCGNTRDVIKTITVITVPDVSYVSPASVTLCAGEQATMTAGAASGGVWATLNSSVATIENTVLPEGGVKVTAQSAGVAAIRYTVTNMCGPSSAYGYVYVNPLPSAGSISVQSGNIAGLCKGQSAQLTSNIGGGNWTTSDNLVATVDQYGVVTGRLEGSATIYYTVGNSCGTAQTSIPVTVLADPNPGSINGASEVCRSGNTMLSATVAGGTWISDHPSIATINSSGVVSGVNTGVATIRYRVANSCGNTRDVIKTITVITVPDVSYVSPASVTLCTGEQATMTAGAASGGLWATLNSSVATIENTVLPEGGVKVTAQSAGVAAIRYTVTNMCGPSSAYGYVYVNPLPSAGTISVQSGNIAGLCKGQSAQLTSNIGGGNWTTSDNLVATVDQYGVVTGRLEGSATIYYTVGNSCGTAQTSIPVTVLADPNPGSINGASEVCRSSSIALSGTVGGGVWISDHPSIATVNSSGVVTGVNIGVATIRYRVANSCGNTRDVTKNINVITVPDVSSVSPASVTLCPGGQITLTAGPASGGVWTTLNSSVATIENILLPEGVRVTAQSAGVATIRYTVTNMCGPSSAYGFVTVNPNPSAGTISVQSGNVAALCIDGEVRLSSSMSGGSWSSSNNFIATVDQNGVVIGRLDGSVTIQYTVGNSCGSAQTSIGITVIPDPTLPNIVGADAMCVNGSTTFTHASSGGIWSSNEPSIASVSAIGLVTGLSAGSTSIRYTTLNACNRLIDLYKPITINPLPSTGTITGPTEVCKGNKIILENAAVTGGSWSSDNANIATINTQTGEITGVQPGTVVITYKVTDAITGCENTTQTTIQVLDQPVVAAISGPDKIKLNNTASYTTTPSGGTWTSSNTIIASIDANGSVQALQTGTTFIQYSITGAGGCSSSQTKQITVYAPLQAVTISPSLSSTDYDGIGELLSCSVLIGGRESVYQLQWQSSPDSTQWTNTDINGAIGNDYRPVDVFNTTYYRLRVTNADETVYSNIASITTPLVGGIIRVSNARMAAGGSAELEHIEPATGAFGNYVYQWQSSTDRQNWQNISGSLANIQRTTWYRRQVNSEGIIGYSNMVTIYITQEPSSVQTPQSGNSPVPTEPVIALPNIGQPDTENRNFIKTRTVTKPGITDASAAALLDNPFDVQQATTYFDGLGRPEQTVLKKASFNGADMISVNVYDAYGREALQYLPYTDGLQTGRFRINAHTQQPQFYQNLYGGSEQYFYGQTQFEASPLNRVLKTTAAGNSFTGANNGVSMLYRSNAMYDSVRIWSVDAAGVLSTPGRYLPGKLYVDETVDEHNKLVITYKDFDGRVVLKKVQLSHPVYPGHIGWLSTYYVYDDFGQLRHVLPPKAVEYLYQNNWNLSAAIDDELCFSYLYDERRRMVEKKVPGAGVVYMVYDQRDRLVFTQDANMRGKTQWMYTLYDGLNRSVETGILSGYSGSRVQLQQLVNAQDVNSTGSSTVTGVRPNSIPEDAVYTSHNLAITSYTASGSITFGTGFNSGSGTFIAEIVPASNGTGFQTTVHTVGAVLPPGAVRTALTVSHYDDYTHTQKTFASGVMSTLSGEHPHAEAVTTAATKATYGMPTVSLVRVLENPDQLSAGSWLESVQYYDEKGRPVQQQSDNYKGGQDINSLRYEFGGKPISEYRLHHNGASNTMVKVLSTMVYDHGGRLVATRKKINEEAERTLSVMSYDELGRMQRKDLGKKADGTTIEPQDYQYTIRGWLSGINKGYGTTSTPNRWFGMELMYDRGHAQVQLNGNIAGTVWRSKGDGEARSFGYGYDNVNRILKADFTQYTDNSWNRNAGLDFSMQMGDGQNGGSAYDANGNIKSMKQWGAKLNSSSLIDELQYNYYGGTNKLQNVIDLRNDTATRLGDFRSSKTYMDQLQNNKTAAATDYSYDVNGNLSLDKNKDISVIGYNHLNLPYRVTVPNKGTITYIYDATGTKLEKRVVEGDKDTKTNYLSGFVYENNKLQFLGQEEGRIRAMYDSTGVVPHYVYDYFVKDHLGNTRMVLTEEWERQIYPAATLETASVETEKLYYQINPAAVVPKPVSLNADYPNNNGIPNPGNSQPQANSTSMYRLNAATGDKMGLGIMLKVMSGDTVSILGKSFWHNNAQTTPDNNYQIPLNDLLLALTGSGTVLNGKGITTTILGTQPVTPGALQELLNNVPQNGSAPKAYINWILLDEQLKPVTNNSGFDAVDAQSEIVKTHTRAVNINRNGYLYVYASNQSNLDVFFDNLQVVHSRGALLEETHYSSWGLALAAISSKSACKLQNKYKFNGGNELQSGEFSDGSGLEMYDAVHRMYDHQLGRFFQIDKLSELSIDFTPYGFARNNPIRMNDPLGLKEDTVNGTSPEVIVTSSKKKVASNAINEYNYGQITGWVDAYRQKGSSVETIQNWALNNPYLSNDALDRIMDATSVTAVAIRDAKVEAWETEGKIFAALLATITGSELLALVEAEAVGVATGRGVASITSKSKNVLKTIDNLIREGGITVNFEVRMGLSKVMKNPPDLAKIAKVAEKLYKNKPLKEALKAIVNEIKKGL